MSDEEMGAAMMDAVVAYGPVAMRKGRSREWGRMCAAMIELCADDDDEEKAPRP